MKTFKRSGAAFLLQFLFWMLFFALSRLVFLAFNYQYWHEADVLSVLAVFFHALRLDLSMTCYLMVLPVLVLIVQSFWSPRFLNAFHWIYTLLIILAYAGIIAAEIGIYPEWHTKMHFKALLYLEHPAEVSKTAGTGAFILLLFVWILHAGGAFFLWWKVFFKSLVRVPVRWWIAPLYLFIILPLMALGIRGGVQQIPINQSTAYFSKHEILNLTAVNSGWNLMHSTYQYYLAMGENPFVSYTEEEAKIVLNSIREYTPDSTSSILSNKRPNIVMFILEGWSAEVLESGGCDVRVAPFMNGLAKDGVTFTQVYSSGTRSQQGMSAIFSGYPAFPYATLTQHPEKYVKLPLLTRVLDSASYYSSYYFGGQLDYGNMKSYIMYNGFDRVIEEADLPSDLTRGKLGVHDGDLFPLVLKDMSKAQQPFFTAIFTMSTHTPYDYTGGEKLEGYALEGDYMSAVHYSDQCLKDFFTAARKQSWYSNTLFVFISDHSHSTYVKHEIFEPAYNKIVFMMYGDPILVTARGLSVEKVGSQIDLPVTLLSQMDLPSSSFVWGKDLLNPASPEYAYYSFEVGLGWVRPCAYYVHEFRGDQTFVEPPDSLCPYTIHEMEKEGRTYLQEAYQNFLDL